MPDLEQLKAELEDIQQALEKLDPGSRAYRNLAEDKAAIEAEMIGSGAIAQGENAFAVGAGGFGVKGDFKIVLGLEQKSLPHPEALARYLENK